MSQSLPRPDWRVPGIDLLIANLTRRFQEDQDREFLKYILEVTEPWKEETKGTSVEEEFFSRAPRTSLGEAK